MLAAFLFLPVSAQAQFWELRKPTTFPTARFGHAMAYDAKVSATMLFGGIDSTGVLGDTWQWDGKNWKQQKPVSSPSARSGAAMAYDSALGKAILFGGSGKNSAQFQDTWTCDGKTWTQLKPTASPSARQYAQMAFDPLRKVMVLFGGQRISKSALTDTWEWDGKTWTQVKTTVQPGTGTTGMVFDEVRKKILLTEWVKPGTRTWEWDGKTWTRLSPLTTPSVSSVYGGRMISDNHRKKVWLYGLNAKNSAWESWQWDGQDWTQYASQGSPILGNLAWDAGRSRIVLFGGKSQQETWEMNLHAQDIQSIGKGCPGSNNMTPTLAAVGDPRPGGIVSWKIAKTLPLMPLVFVFGFDKVNFDLKALGAPGCVLLANTHSVIPGQADLNGRWHTIGIRVPMNPKLVGGKFWTQVLAFDAKANSFGLTISNGLEITVGY